MNENFIKFRDRLNQHFQEMVQGVNRLFEVEVDKDLLWRTYLESIPASENSIFRKNREYDCHCCKKFIKEFGGVVVIKDNKINTIWDFPMDGSIFESVVKVMAGLVKAQPIKGIYLSKTDQIGTAHNTVMMESIIAKFDHFAVSVPSQFIHRNGTGLLLNAKKTRALDSRNIFKRSLDGITLESIDIVVELINSNSIYRGAEWLPALTTFRSYKCKYETLTERERELFTWEKSAEGGEVVSHIKNTSMGNLLCDISGGMELDKAVARFEKIVAPLNYKRPKPIFTLKMLDAAREKLNAMGYIDSLKRRRAVIDDLSVNDILFANRDSKSQIPGADDIFDSMAKKAVEKAKRFDRTEEISIQDFIHNVLPTATEVDVYLENRHETNLVSLIAPVNAKSKSMFKWDNNFSWAYTGNIADSMKQRVKEKGGNVDGDLRFSIQWNDTGDHSDNYDLDAHCITPPSPMLVALGIPNKGEHIYYHNKFDRLSHGGLDVDIRDPKGKAAVENITWAKREQMVPGTYQFYVHMYRGNLRYGFRAEIEFDNHIYSFNYPHAVKENEQIKIADVTLSNGEFSIKKHLPDDTTSKEIWGLKTNTFVPVRLICFSPNYWNYEKCTGNQQVFFMLENCVSKEEPNGFYNEFLNSELNEHRKVLEALGAQMKVENCADQLSGIGFSLTKRNELVVKVKGNTERILKIKF